MTTNLVNNLPSNGVLSVSLVASEAQSASAKQPKKTNAKHQQRPQQEEEADVDKQIK